jgi:protein TonB
MALGLCLLLHGIFFWALWEQTHAAAGRTHFSGRAAAGLIEVAITAPAPPAPPAAPQASAPAHAPSLADKPKVSATSSSSLNAAAPATANDENASQGNDFTIGTPAPAASATAPDFRQLLLAHIQAYRQYPPEARAQRLQGEVNLAFVINRAGAVLGVWVVASSGHPVLDQEAVNTIMRAEPMPPIPPGVADPLRIELPVDFFLSQ